MTFWLKKQIAAFLLPLPLALVMIVIALLLFLIRRAKITRWVCMMIAILVLCIFSSPLISNRLLNQLQHQYSALLEPPNDVDQVVVLGGGVAGNKNYPPNLTLGAASLSRLIEGIRLFKLLAINHPDAQLILSGGHAYRSFPTEAGTMSNTAVMLGVDRNNILLENGSQDTHDEALFLKKLVKEKPFVLVTSAYHMPRAIALFEKQGMRPIAAPTQFFNRKCHGTSCYLPSTYSLVSSDIAIHELLGMLWAKNQGYISR